MFSANTNFLIVDDDPTIIASIRKGLQGLNLNNIDEASDGQSALQLLRASAAKGKKYGLVFCDIHMPVMDGLKFLEAVRADNTISQTPIVMCTTESAKPTVVRAVMSGISGYMVKPFETKDVQDKVNEIYSRIQQVEQPG